MTPRARRIAQTLRKAGWQALAVRLATDAVDWAILAARWAWKMLC